MMKHIRRLPVFLASLFMLPPAAQAETPAEGRQKEYSLDRSHLAMNGYDPVSYRQPSGPQEGSKQITAEFKGVMYRFVSEKNKTEFLKNPAKYEPEYGGWCAWAMLDGGRTKSNPESYKIVDEKLYLFYDKFFVDTLKKWNKRAAKTPEPSLIKEADRQWAKQLD